MVRVKVRKHLYWHPLAKVLLEHGLMPKYCADAIKEIYPHGDITGRHIGAYKRRLITDGLLDKNVPKTVSPNDAVYMIEGLVGEDDRFIYQCQVGSAKRTLKCFEYKLTHEAIDNIGDIEGWITNIQA